MTFENRLGDDEIYYPAHIEAVLKDDQKRLYLGFKIDPDSQRILDCRWNEEGLENERERLETFSNEVIGMPWKEALKKDGRWGFLDSAQIIEDSNYLVNLV